MEQQGPDQHDAADDTSRSDDEPEIVYVPGAANHYDYDHDVVILDRRLKDYPTAHDAILEHERKHAEHARQSDRWLLDLIQLEWREDVRYYLEETKDAEAIRRYYREREPSRPISLSESLKLQFVHLARPFWSAVLALAATFRGGDPDR